MLVVERHYIQPGQHSARPPGNNPLQARNHNADPCDRLLRWHRQRHRRACPRQDARRRRRTRIARLRPPQRGGRHGRRAGRPAHAEELLERGAQWLGHAEVSRHVILSASTGEGLRALAERENADLVVFGSDWHTAPGHVQPGQSALRLMDGGPVSVAIAAAGLRNRSDAALRTIALAGGEVDEAARTTAEQLAARAGTALALPSQDGVDLLVVGSRPGTPVGQVGVTAANEYVVETDDLERADPGPRHRLRRAAVGRPHPGGRARAPAVSLTALQAATNEPALHPRGAGSLA
jgi:nucleotide-binding universal stress UspA family protein